MLGQKRSGDATPERVQLLGFTALHSPKKLIPLAPTTSSAVHANTTVLTTVQCALISMLQESIGLCHPREFVHIISFVCRYIFLGIFVVIMLYSLLASRR